MQNGNYGQNQSLHQSVKWSPVVGGGTTFRTFKLGQVSDARWEYRSTWRNYVFAVPFLIGGSFLCYAYGRALYSGERLNVLAALLCLGVLALGIFLLRRALKKYIFDFQLGIYWETPVGFGKKEDPELAKGEVIALNEVIALQVLIEEWESKNSESGFWETRRSYELNFVFENARYNIVDHGDLKAVVREGRALAQKMGVPLLLQDSKWQRL